MNSNNHNISKKDNTLINVLNDDEIVSSKKIFFINIPPIQNMVNHVQVWYTHTQIASFSPDTHRWMRLIFQ